MVPLGDTLARRKLVVAKLALLTFILILMGFATSLAQFLPLSIALGFLATVAQDMVALTADSATPTRRGKAIGTVMSGLFTGVLISRTFSGVVASSFGWRAVFWIAAAVQCFAVLLLFYFRPTHAERAKIAYVDLLKSMFHHIRTKSRLRSVIVTHGLVGMAFSAFWTCLAFHLSSPAMAFSTSQIGLFGLVGAAGTLVAPFAGRAVDRRGPSTGILAGTAASIAGFALMLINPYSIYLLVVGAFIFDMGLQISLISHQTIVYALDQRAIARLNAIFFTGIFLAFALGSTIGVQVFGSYGLPGVLILATVLSTLAFANGLSTVRRSFSESN